MYKSNNLVASNEEVCKLKEINLNHNEGCVSTISKFILI
jgi:hypothetical protein